MFPLGESGRGGNDIAVPLRSRPIAGTLLSRTRRNLFGDENDTLGFIQPEQVYWKAILASRDPMKVRPVVNEHHTPIRGKGVSKCQASMQHQRSVRNFDLQPGSRRKGYH